MAKKASKQADNTINIKAMPVQMHIGSQKYINDDWGTMAYIIDRREIQNKFADPELRYNCIYFLFGYENNMEMCYVGQAKKRNDGESVLARLREHDKSTTEKYCDIWDWIVVVTNKNDAWTLDDLNALEHAFYAEIPTEQNLNGNNPNAGGADFDSYIDKIEQIKALVTTIGFSIFAEKTETDNIQVISETNEFTIVEDLQNGMARIPEIVTPHKVVKAMVDMLPADVWSSKTVFLDPACKGGEYLREIYDRLMENETLQAEYPNDIERSNHILSEQLYGIALSQVSLERTTKKLMGFGMNIRVIPNYIDRLKGLNMGKRPDGSQNNIKDIINKEFGKEMKIDVVIGNPPYQEINGGGNGNGATALYNRFVTNAMEQSNHIVSFIIPARWFTGGRGVDKFKEFMLSNTHIKSIVYYPNSKDVFRNLSIAGGVCYFTIDLNKEYIELEYCVKSGEQSLKSKRRINEFESFIRDDMALSILRKLKSDRSFSNMVSPIGYYKIPTSYDEIYIGDDAVNVITSKGCSEISIDDISNAETINCYRVYLSTITVEHAGEPDKSGMYKIFGRMGILKPNEVCSDSYLVIGMCSDIKTAENIMSYLKTKTVRFIVQQFMVGIHITQKTFTSIPLVDFSKTWDDKSIKNNFNLSDEEIAYIENTIKPMD